MLSLLRIQNVAVIERAEIEFGAGLNVMTGETGAGKSIVIDSLCAVLGQRTSRELIRSGADTAAVTAVFCNAGVNAWLEENGLDGDMDGELVIMRKMSREGKGLCRVNGLPVSVGQLRELGEQLIHIHGQNDVGCLLDEAYHLDYLDGFAGLREEAAAYRRLYQAYLAAGREIEALRLDEAEKARRMDSLQFQIAELEGAGLKPGEMENLQAQRQLQKNAEKLTQALSLAFEALYGAGTSDGGALAELAEAEAALSRIETCSAQLPELVERLRSSRLDTEDVAEQLRDLRSSLDFSPEAFERLEERLDQLRRLSRKYGQDEAAMLAYLDSRKEELEQIESAGQRLQELQARMEEKKTACRTAAQALDEKRRKAAAALQARIAEELAQLNMPAVRFQVDFQEKADGDFDQNGLHEVRFLMSANAGQALGRISRIASGGELSRIMLAMKNVLAGVENIPTLVFDEIDTGVSGVAAQRVGEKLSQLAGTRQVLCVTHLPQIAAMGDIHFSIEKQTREGQTYTQVQPLSGQERERELARLYGGENITETTLHAAAEQLRAAADYKEKRRR